MSIFTLIDFRASWCVSCRDENQNLLAIYNSYKTKGFGVIGVAFGKTGKIIARNLHNEKLRDTVTGLLK